MPGYRLLSLKKSGRDIIVSVESEGEVEIPACVQCGSADCVRNGRRATTVRDVVDGDLTILLDIQRRRFRCKACGHPFFESLPGILGRRRMTSRLVEHIQTQIFSMPFNALARTLRMDEKSVRNVAEDYFRELERKTQFSTPKVLAVIEVPAAGVPCTLLVDAEEGALVGFVESRTSKQLRNALLAAFGEQPPAQIAFSLDETTPLGVTAAFPKGVRLRLYTPWLMWRIEAQFRIVISGVREWRGNALERRVMASPLEALVDLPFVNKSVVQTSIDASLAAHPRLWPHFSAYMALQDIFLHRSPGEWSGALEQWSAQHPSNVRRPYRWVASLIQHALDATPHVIGPTGADRTHGDLYLVREVLRLYSHKRSLQSIRAMLLYQPDTHRTMLRPDDGVMISATDLHKLSNRLRTQLTGFDSS